MNKSTYHRFCLVCDCRFAGDGWTFEFLPHYILTLCSERCCSLMETKYIPELDNYCGKCGKIVDRKLKHCPCCYPEAQTDNVNHPRHYKNHPSGVECIQITEHMNFCLGNAMKYLWRAEDKGGLEDLKKAAWYIQREIERRDP